MTDERKITRLHQILAVESDAEGVVKQVLPEAKHTFHAKPDHFLGYNKEWRMLDEEKQAEAPPPERKELVTTVHEKLDYLARALTEYWDLVLTKEAANQDARADVIIGGITIGMDLPATFLLGMESKLKQLREVLKEIPTLAPGQEWYLNADRGQHVYQAAHAEHTQKTKKVPVHKVLVDPTKEHPAQIEKWHEDQVVATSTKTIWSGMLTPAEKSEMLSRLDKLLQAVKQARQAANMQEAPKQSIGTKMMSYIIYGQT